MLNVLRTAFSRMYCLLIDSFLELVLEANQQTDLFQMYQLIPRPGKYSEQLILSGIALGSPSLTLPLVLLDYRRHAHLSVAVNRDHRH